MDGVIFEREMTDGASGGGVEAERGLLLLRAQVWLQNGAGEAGRRRADGGWREGIGGATQAEVTREGVGGVLQHQSTHGGEGIHGASTTDSR